MTAAEWKIWAGTIVVAAGGVLVALGGWLATRGWADDAAAETRQQLLDRDTEQRANQRRAMLRILAAEAERNLHILNSDPTLNEQDPAQLAASKALPRFETDGVTAAITSGVFAEPTDKPIFKAISDLQLQCSVANQHIAHAESIHSGNLHAQQMKELQDGKSLKSVRDRTETLRGLIRKAGVDPDEKFFD